MKHTANSMGVMTGGLANALKAKREREEQTTTTTAMLERQSSSSLELENNVPSNEELLEQIQSEAMSVVAAEPVLCGLLHRTILHATSSHSLADLLSNTVCYRLLLGTDHAAVCPIAMRDKFVQCLLDEETLEMGHTMMEAVKQDILAVCQRDPAMDTPLQVVLFSKGFAALVCHRAAYRLHVKGSKFTALYLQSQASATFGVDIHPHAQLGHRLMLDHGTGVVIGETAQVGDGCTFLHGVTLGGTGKQHGDRHPKIGENVLIGANASLLGNIRIGDRVKIGAGSVVLRPIPDGATAVGVPAKIIGKSNENKPGSDMDETLNDVSLFREHGRHDDERLGTRVRVGTTAQSRRHHVVDDHHFDRRRFLFVGSDLSVSRVCGPGQTARTPRGLYHVHITRALAQGRTVCIGDGILFVLFCTRCAR
jgi:serine O-acetyltransferase